MTDKPQIPELLEQWHSQPMPIRIVHVGAGATGLCAAYKMERQLTNYELVCYEKNPDVGGTWYENRYPGCACDVPAHIYTYTFEPNPEWTSYYAYAPDILKYFKGFCEKYNLQKYVALNHKVLSARWLEEKGQYEVLVEHGDKTFKDYAHIFMNGSGLLNKWRWPDIDGLGSFKGSLIHSANWDDSVELEGKRVAVLGTGSSAIQIIPKAGSLPLCDLNRPINYYRRGNTWIAPPMPRVKVEVSSEADKETGLTNGDHKEESDIDVSQYFYKTHEIDRFRSDPDYLLHYRKQIEYGINAGFSVFYKGSELSQLSRQYMIDSMTRRLKNHPELTKRLIPTWPVGCRRLTPGDGYLEALIESNVQPIYDEIVLANEKGVTTGDGKVHELDVIVCATGFDMAWTPHFELYGVEGIRIQDEWSSWPLCYLGIAAPGFPNYWVMNGPRGNLANGTVLPCLETQIDYIIAAAKKIQSDRICALEIRRDITERLDMYIDKWHERGVWTADCRSWYKNNTKDGKPRCWGGSSMHYLKTIRYPRWEHYNFRYVDDNPWAFLGNGQTKGEVEREFEGMTPYLRNADVPWDIV
ncbi:hypothetical protein AJ79_02942 [Helicocarpus griseus UAMH5409]|uniref:FAD/NAD(P)-binding domain-containing protein n=1 Tax=Helicocarpus griseus UAMH5409 TaxID=1447875 RepID=A0A2B7Y1L3_9EURO|nr:hypothetical protein AJ79_02942 [Helicocarpus griseus UAMH5409]